MNNMPDSNCKLQTIYLSPVYPFPQACNCMADSFAQLKIIATFVTEAPGTGEMDSPAAGAAKVEHIR
jgi:hypothetical protein